MKPFERGQPQLLDTIGHVYNIAKAVDVATQLGAEDEDGWTYEVDRDPKGSDHARVRILDECGEFVGYF